MLGGLETPPKHVFESSEFPNLLKKKSLSFLGWLGFFVAPAYQRPTRRYESPGRQTGERSSLVGEELKDDQKERVNLDQMLYVTM